MFIYINRHKAALRSEKEFTTNRTQRTLITRGTLSTIIQDDTRERPRITAFKKSAADIRKDLNEYQYLRVTESIPYHSDPKQEANQV